MTLMINYPSFIDKLPKFHQMLYLSSMANLIRRIFNNPIISHSNKYMSTKTLHKTVSVGFVIFYGICILDSETGEISNLW